MVLEKNHWPQFRANGDQMQGNHRFEGFTDFLRLKFNVSRRPSREDEADDETYLRIQREQVLKHHQRNFLPSWSELKAGLKERTRSGNVSEKEVKERLRELMAIALELTGEEWPMDLVEAASMFILQLFYDSYFGNNMPGTCAGHKDRLTAMFGASAVNSALINRAYEASKSLFGMIDEGDLNFMFNSQANAQNVNIFKKNVDELEPMRDVEWGSELEESLDMDLFKPSTASSLNFLSWDSLIEGRKSSSGFELSFQYKEDPNSRPLNNALEGQNTVKSKKDLDWLNRKLSDCLRNDNDLGLTVADLMETLLSMLQTSSKSDQEIEGDLLSLLGISRVNIIRDIIESRKDIIDCCRALYNQNKPETDHVILAKAAFKSRSLIPDKKPTIGQSIVVHTEEEKNLKKLVRKYEKKAIKEINKESKEMAENGVTISDVERMKEEREKALIQAMCGPLFKENTSSSKPEQYPFVFDSYLEAKQSAAFISGHKMILPTGFQRNDDRKWEEISIPPATKPPDYVVENFKPVKIEDLDSVGQVAFQGIEQLNQIQSIVFNTAYYSNENMLICAPTGAGKTNVAMLAVMHEVRQHLDENNRVKKANFKVVYIAPMKALAAEMTANFSRKLRPLGIVVKELTGDMQLTKNEIMETQMIITTPEKWDVVTRKSKGDVQLMQLVKLLIIDEVHLLQSDRGPVLEALVARTIRHVEMTQQMIRLVGLSATLPNYVDVASFLRVNLYKGLFFFDGRFRPVPLGQAFVGVKATQSLQQMLDMDEICYDKVVKIVSAGNQCMVFVHARNSTYKLATVLRDRAFKEGQSAVFESDSKDIANACNRSRNKMLKELFPSGFAIHHAGLLRSDRTLVENLFKDGGVKVLCCTSTLAWGVNLPAHAVIIRGTEMYDSAHGTYVDLSMLDVMQIFGRAGRPQYDTEGFGTIITTHDKLRFYLSMLTSQYPIESNFIKFLIDNMNAEIVSGTITTIDEAVDWMSYTYLFIRMRRNPLGYGISYEMMKNDPQLFEFRKKLAIESAESLDKAKMIRFDERTGSLDPTDLGRTASHYYIKYDTIEKFNASINEYMMEDEILGMVCQAQEFDQLKSREDEMNELHDLQKEACHLKVSAPSDTKLGKVNILLQSFLSRARVESFSLISDSMFVTQNIIRMARGLFEYVLKMGWALLANKMLLLSKMLEKQMWNHQTPFAQFPRELDYEILKKMEMMKSRLTPERLRSEEMSEKEIGNLIRNASKGSVVKQLAHTLPYLEVKALIQPITRTVLRVTLDVTPGFYWHDYHHGKSIQSFWIWMQDSDSNHIYHYEYLSVTKKQVVKKETQQLIFTIPLLDPDRIPSHYLIHCDSDHWLGCDTEESVSCKNLILPEKFLPYTNLLDLDPLPVSALNNPLFESIYKFSHFNPIQTQLFHTLQHTDSNVLLGAPTGSGKTIAAELAMFRLFSCYPSAKVVYIAPMKALVRERVDDWRRRLETSIGKKIVELTGDVTPDSRAILEADIIVTTPEKWDGVSRSWQTRRYVRDVGLIVIDEIHLLGEDRGPVLEVIVSRTNFISANTGRSLRIIGLSTAIANAQDLANWLMIGKVGLYNFKPSVRPVPLEVHVSGYPGKHYCPRMALMNKPTFRAILQHSPDKPALVFVSSRRQTRLTALDLIAFLAGEDNPRQWLHMPEDEMDYLAANVKDINLRLTLAFGIGLHHAGLQEKDRTLCEELFLNHKIQVLITTATLAWGVNLPAHLVVIKGTEYFDGKQKRYVDFPITDVLQMMGRAGRPQYDKEGKAVVLVHDIKKEYYKKFLYEPFPVESSLVPVLPDHLNAEIVAGTVHNKQECLDYLTWTYLFRRILKNPAYYQLEDVDNKSINKFLSNLIDSTIDTLIQSSCVFIDEADQAIRATPLGKIASFYYIHHLTMKLFSEQLMEDSSDVVKVMDILTKASEYNELPVRHNEDKLNEELAKLCRFPVPDLTYDSPHTKANLLLQAHFSRLELPCTDYLTDLKSVLDQAIRVIQAMIDVSALHGLLSTTVSLVSLLQMILQAAWCDKSPLLTLPYIDESNVGLFDKCWGGSLPQVIQGTRVSGYNALGSVLRSTLDEGCIEEIHKTLSNLPVVEVTVTIKRTDPDSGDQGTSLKTYSPQEPLQKRNYLSLEGETEYLLVIDLKRLGGEEARSQGNRRANKKAMTPKFSKSKDEGWFLVVGNIDAKELVALKRIGYIGLNRSKQNLVFTTPSSVGRVIYTLYLLSDCYLGLDQQLELCFDIKSVVKRDNCKEQLQQHQKQRQPQRRRESERFDEDEI